MNNITQILDRAQQGDPKAAEELLPLVYEELRKMAAKKMKNEAAGHTLQPTALVHEDWLRLVAENKPEWEGQGLIPGGTAGLAVPGGKLPPSRTHGHRSPDGGLVVRTQSAGRVAHRHGPVARSAWIAPESFSAARFWSAPVLWRYWWSWRSESGRGLSHSNTPARGSWPG